MPVAEMQTLRSGLQPRSYSAALFACNFRRQDAYALYAQANGIHVHSTLRKDEWESLDRIVVDAGKEPLKGVMALRATPALLRTESIAISLAQYNRMSLMPPANISMNPLADGTRGRVDFGIAGVPVPFVFVDFQLDIRTLTASRQLGSGLDLTQGAEASYQVALTWETMLFNGTPAIAVADRVGALNTIYGYKTHPDRNTGLAVGDWGDATSGMLNTINTVEAMKQALRDDRFDGPYWLYVNSVNWSDIGRVNAYTDRRVIQILRDDPDLSKVEYSPRLDAGEIVLIAPTPRTVQWVEEAMIRPVEWDEKGGLGTNYRVIGAGAPLIKSTSNGECGIAHFTQAT